MSRHSVVKRAKLRRGRSLDALAKFRKMIRLNFGPTPIEEAEAARFFAGVDPMKLILIGQEFRQP